MKIKNIQLSILILAGLIFSSFAFFVVAQERSNTDNNIFLDSDQDGLTDEEETLYGTDPRNPDTDGDGYSDGAEVKSGYNPLKPAPGDKIVKDTSNQNSISLAVSGDNLTQNLAQKVIQLTSSDSEDKEISVDDIAAAVNDSLNSNSGQQNIDDEIKVDKSEIKIKKQDYSKLSKDRQKEKMKEDFSDYLVAVVYILSSNSPDPLTSDSDISSLGAKIGQKIITALNNRDASGLEDFQKSGEKTLEQLKDVEVPEDLVDIHIKALKFAKYSQKMESYINANPEDPIKDIANLSRIEGLVSSLSSFANEVKNKSDEYDLQYGDVKDKLKNYGLDFPKNSALLKQILESENDDE